jgi:hypothetical protein
MFGSTILDLATGLIFTFLTISLMTSAATEVLASALAWRANTLLHGIKDLLNDQQFTGLALSIYNHDLVNPRSNGTAASVAQLTAKPSYIDAKQFACALIDATGILPGANVQVLQTRINTVVTDKQLNTMLNGMVVRADGDINRIRDEIAAWFNSAMDRVAGVYKRKTQLWSFIIAVVLAIVLNIDTIKIAQALWDQPMVMKGLSAPPAGETAQQAFDQLQTLGLPFGWDDQARSIFLNNPNYLNNPKWLYAILGWLITAAATLFGAPFWFDTLQRFVQLRGAGSK